MDDGLAEKLQQFKQEAEQFAAQVQFDCNNVKHDGGFENGNEIIEGALHREQAPPDFQRYLDQLHNAKEGLFKQREALLQQQARIEQQLSQVEYQEQRLDEIQPEIHEETREFTLDSLDNQIAAALEQIHDEEERSEPE